MATSERRTSPALPDFVGWPTFPFEGDLRVRPLDPPTAEPPRQGEGGANCAKCAAPDAEYIWIDERWRVRALNRPSGLPAVVVLETRGHYDVGDLSNMLAAELGVLTVRLERAIRSIDGVERVHVNRWGDGSEHLHVFFLARPRGLLQLRGTFLSMWDDILPPISERRWRENLAFIAAWLADYSGEALAEPPPLHWEDAPDENAGRHVPDPAPLEASSISDRDAINPARAVGVASVVGVVGVASAMSASHLGESPDPYGEDPNRLGSDPALPGTDGPEAPHPWSFGPPRPRPTSETVNPSAAR